MPWWKFSDALRFSPVVSEIVKSNNNNGYGLAREAIFYHLLSLSCENIKLSDSRHLAKILNAPEGQVKIVWEICLKNHVIREIEDNAYSAIEWMRENKLLYNNDRKQALNQSKVTQTKDDVLFSESANQISPIPQPPSMETVIKPKVEKPKNQWKEQVRPNVRLTRDELNSLKEQFSADEVEQILNKLSEYKTNSGRIYSSDYEAINRWVIRSFQEKKMSSRLESKITPSCSIPEWVYGR